MTQIESEQAEGCSTTAVGCEDVRMMTQVKTVKVSSLCRGAMERGDAAAIFATRIRPFIQLVWIHFVVD